LGVCRPFAQISKDRFKRLVPQESNMAKVFSFRVFQLSALSVNKHYGRTVVAENKKYAAGIPPSQADSMPLNSGIHRCHLRLSGLK
jgi:hypothetical protein